MDSSKINESNQRNSEGNEGRKIKIQICHEKLVEMFTAMTDIALVQLRTGIDIDASPSLEERWKFIINSYVEMPGFFHCCIDCQVEDHY